MANTENIKALIIQRFRQQKSRPNDIIDEGVIRFNIWDKLNPAELDLYDTAVKELFDEQILLTEQRGSGIALVLTETGYNLIYKVNEEEAIGKIGGLIMDKFKTSNSKVGYLLDEWWFSQKLGEDLNPKEIDLIERSVNKLIDDGYIEMKGKRGIVLTKKGFDEIY